MAEFDDLNAFNNYSNNYRNNIDQTKRPRLAAYRTLEKTTKRAKN